MDNPKVVKKHRFGHLLYFGLVFGLLACFCLLCPIKIVMAQDSADAIAIRVISNPDHFSALRWYRSKDFTGSPQSMIIDGYEAVRDGQTVYVNAANVDLGADNLYTNIYVITYNLKAEATTQDIFSQILSHWTFNTNLISATTWGGETAECSKDATVRCITDKDCERKGICNSAKAQVTRDTIRLARLYDIDLAVREYGVKYRHYPKLTAGTYIQNITISVWPSWQAVFAQDLGSALAIDPINKLRDCGSSRFNPISCWDERAREFAWSADIKNATLPSGNYVFLYKYGTAADPAAYTLCAFSETGMFPDPSTMCNRDCVPYCFHKECGEDNCGGECGACPSGQSCQNGRCFFGCTTGPGCRDSLFRGHTVAGYCAAGGCYECDIGYAWQSPNCVCAPTCNTVGQPNCRAAAPPGGTRGYGVCCNPGEICYQCPFGTTWNGSSCVSGCSPSCNTSGEPNCLRAKPANSNVSAGTCCNAGEVCYKCQNGLVFDSGTNRCYCPAVTINPINDATIYAAPPGPSAYHFNPTSFSANANASGATNVIFSLSNNPSWLIIGPSTGQIQGAQTVNINNVFSGIMINARNACGSSASDSFTLTVLPNGWCGDGVLQPAEDCEASGGGTSATDMWQCLSCAWTGGWCGDTNCDFKFENFNSCPDCLIDINTDFNFCTQNTVQPACYSGAFPTPTLPWTITPAGVQAAFAVQIDNNFNFTSPEIDTGEISGTLNSYTLDQLGLQAGYGNPADPNDGYFWRLKIRDIFGTWSDWAECTGPFDTPGQC